MMQGELKAMSPVSGSGAFSKILHGLSYSIAEEQQTFSVKCQIENILGLAGHSASISTTEFCCCVTKAATQYCVNTVKTRGHDCVPIKLYGHRKRIYFIELSCVVKCSFFLISFQPFKNIKLFLAQGLHKDKWQVFFGLEDVAGQPLP